MLDSAVTVEEAEQYSGLFEDENGHRVRTERIDGHVYMMSPSPHYKHGVINGHIYMAISRALGRGQCQVFMENLDFKYHQNSKDESKKRDYVTPDIMIACEPELLKGSAYYGVPKFIVETSSPSTARRDRTVKLRIYEAAGVSEYWIVNPIGTIDIYYLVDGRYRLEQSITRCYDTEEEDYNENMTLTLREFPNVTMTIGEIFC